MPVKLTLEEFKYSQDLDNLSESQLKEYFDDEIAVPAMCSHNCNVMRGEYCEHGYPAITMYLGMDFKSMIQ